MKAGNQGQLHKGWTEKSLGNCASLINSKNRDSRIPPTKRCRDCPAEFELADPRRILCDGCRKEARRANHRRQMQAWWKRQPDMSRRAVYRRQWQGQKRRFGKLRPELQGVVLAIGNLRRRISR